MKTVLKHLFVWLGCLHFLGGPFAVLQVSAWMMMLVTYSSQDGLVTGMKDTFSGERPCAMCKSIQTAKSHSQENPQEPAESPTNLRTLVMQPVLPINQPRLSARKGSAYSPPAIPCRIYHWDDVITEITTPPPRDTRFA